MSKFINKKEQVIDLKLTTYARYLLSIGQFEPEFYAFFDDNVLYDRMHACTSSAESQTNVDFRIKEETQYLEGLTLFKDLEETAFATPDTSVDFIVKKPTQRILYPDAAVFNVENSIGDAFLDGPAQTAPSWKVAALNSFITSSTTIDPDTNSRIPQINIESTYLKRIVKNEFVFDPENIRQVSSRTPGFSDERVIELVSQEPVLYVEEANTRTLTKNFDMEVFELIRPTKTLTPGPPELRKLNFRKQKSNIQNEYLISETQNENVNDDLTTDDVEYYFDVLLDSNVNEKIACKGLDLFNKDSYYIDLDFDCLDESSQSFYYDIYGATTEPEICQS